MPDPKVDCAVCGQSIFDGNDYFELTRYTSNIVVLTAAVFCSGACLAKYASERFGLDTLADK